MNKVSDIVVSVIGLVRGCRGKDDGSLKVQFVALFFFLEEGLIRNGNLCK